MSHPRSVPGIDQLSPNDGAADIYRELYRGVEYAIISAVPGHIAEFGTSSGRTAMTLAKAMADIGGDKFLSKSEEHHGIEPRKLYLFDGFEGFPFASHPIDQASPHIVANVWGPGATKDAGPGLLRQMCEVHLPTGRIEIIAGWYKDTMPRLEPGLKLAMVHIDCDFYASTMDVLDRLFAIDAFSDGCAIFFDDWYCNRGSPDFGEQKAWADCIAKFKPRYTDWGPYATVGRRFIVHR
jgi:O-methyltransferase